MKRWRFSEISDAKEETTMDSKQFDVRKEMLARPNEWVGAYEWKGRWFKVGFSTETMSARQSKHPLIIGMDRKGTDLSFPIKFENCIPIEDVPEEEWK